MSAALALQLAPAAINTAAGLFGLLQKGERKKAGSAGLSAARRVNPYMGADMALRSQERSFRTLSRSGASGAQKAYAYARGLDGRLGVAGAVQTAAQRRADAIGREEEALSRYNLGVDERNAERKGAALSALAGGAAQGANVFLQGGHENRLRDRDKIALASQRANFETEADFEHFLQQSGLTKKGALMEDMGPIIVARQTARAVSKHRVPVDIPPHPYLSNVPQYRQR